MPRCSVSTRRPRFKPSIASTRGCRLAPGGPSATASSTIGMARSRSMLRSTPKAARSWVRTAAHHTTEEFVAFLGQIVALQPRGREIHIIADNLSAHKTKRVSQFLAEHPKLHLHFTPTYSSWLNQVELWFGRIEREVGRPRGLH